MAFRDFFSKMMQFPAVRAQEEAEEEAELVDPLTANREACAERESIAKLYEKYQACNDRVNAESKTTDTWMEERVDYIHELDHCATHGLWAKLK